MFDIGFWELLVIGIIALLVIGPERLPSFIRSTANTIKSIKSVANGFKDEMSEQLRTHELHENLKKAEKMGMEHIGGDIKKSVDELRAAAESVQEPYKKSKAGNQANGFTDSLERSSKKPAVAEPVKADKDLSETENSIAPPAQTAASDSSKHPTKAPQND